MSRNKNMNKNKRQRIKKRQNKDAQKPNPSSRAASAKLIQKQNPFSRLTPEILTNICSLLFPTHHNLQDVFEVDGPAIIHHRWKHVYNLSLVDRRCRTIISPFLYRCIPIPGPRSLTKLLSFVRFVTDKPTIAQGIQQLYLQLEVVNSGVTVLSQDDAKWVVEQAAETGTPFCDCKWKGLPHKQEFEWKGTKRAQSRVPERPMKRYTDEVETRNWDECQRMETLLLILLRRLPGLVDLGLEHGKRVFSHVYTAFENQRLDAGDRRRQNLPPVPPRVTLPSLPTVRSVAMKINRSATEWQHVDDKDVRILMEMCLKTERLSVEELKPVGRLMPWVNPNNPHLLPWLNSVRKLTLTNSRSVDSWKEMAAVALYIRSCPVLEEFRFMAKYRETREGTPHRVRVPQEAMLFLENALTAMHFWCLRTLVLDFRHCTQSDRPPAWGRLREYANLKNIYLNLGHRIPQGSYGYRDRNKMDREATEVLKALPPCVRVARLAGEFWLPKPLKRLIRNHKRVPYLHDIEVEGGDDSDTLEAMASLQERFAQCGTGGGQLRSPQSSKPVVVGSSAAKIWPRPVRSEWREDAPEILRWTNRELVVYGTRKYPDPGAKLVVQKPTTIPTPSKKTEMPMPVWLEWMHPATEPGKEPTLRRTNMASEMPMAIWPNYEDAPRSTAPFATDLFPPASSHVIMAVASIIDLPAELIDNILNLATTEVSDDTVVESLGPRRVADCPSIQRQRIINSLAPTCRRFRAFFEHEQHRIIFLSKRNIFPRMVKLHRVLGSTPQPAVFQNTTQFVVDYEEDTFLAKSYGDKVGYGKIANKLDSLKGDTRKAGFKAGMTPSRCGIFAKYGYIKELLTSNLQTGLPPAEFIAFSWLTRLVLWHCAVIDPNHLDQALKRLSRLQTFVYTVKSSPTPRWPRYPMYEQYLAVRFPETVTTLCIDAPLNYWYGRYGLAPVFGGLQKLENLWVNTHSLSRSGLGNGVGILESTSRHDRSYDRVDMVTAEGDLKCLPKSLKRLHVLGEIGRLREDVKWLEEAVGRGRLPNLKEIAVETIIEDEDGPEEGFWIRYEADLWGLDREKLEGEGVRFLDEVDPRPYL
ncbi:hypothetical protein K4K61_002698 [Colletotrichum sp. SAR11_59]|nr:hypothetical protein K4K61_002698 [Colletotrichum sp. SAR11_59]